MSSVTFSAGTQVDGLFTFKLGEHTADLNICKKETTEKSYKLAITYLGFPFVHNYGKNLHGWKVEINDQVPRYNGAHFDYFSSKKFEVRPAGGNSILIEETDETQTGKIWVDTSTVPYNASYSPIELDERIIALMEKAKIFIPANDMRVKQIFYHNSVGVIIYSGDDNWNSNIYFAAIDEDDFTKAEAECEARSKSPEVTTYWKVKIPNETVTHTLTFAEKPECTSGVEDPSWDDTPLKRTVV